MTLKSNSFIPLINYPLSTEKQDQLTKKNQYSFSVDKKSTKSAIKEAIEELFTVKVVAVNTSMCRSKRRQNPPYKKAIVRLAPENSIDMFEEN